MAEFAVTFYDYAFPRLYDIRDNFDTADVAVVRTLNGDGGFDSYGADDALSAVGRVDVTFALLVDDADTMQGSIDDVRKLRSYGKRKLYWQSQGTLAQRWCWARMISNPVKHGPLTEEGKYQRLTASFSVNDPHWYENEGTATIVISGTVTNGTITHNGNAPALARITLQPSSGGTVAAPVLQRLEGATVYDEVSYSGTATTSTLTINAQSKSVTYGTANAYSSFDFDHPDWFRLMPGANVIKITATNAAAAGTVAFYHYPTYR